jgi:hypothetical protein
MKEFNFLVAKKGGIMLCKRLLLTGLLTTILVGSLSAESSAPRRRYRPYKRFGVGVVLGKPTGINFKYWFNYSTAVDFGIHWPFETPLGLNVDLLAHARPLYTGLGICASVGSSSSLDGIRGIFGGEFFSIPLSVFLEIVPVYWLDSSNIGIQWGIGARIYF